MMDVFQYSERSDVGLPAKDVIHDHDHPSVSCICMDFSLIKKAKGETKSL